MLAFTARNFVSKVQPKLIFNECKRTMAVVPFKLADIGEGIAEVELMKWFIKVLSRKCCSKVCRKPSLSGSRRRVTK